MSGNNEKPFSGDNTGLFDEVQKKLEFGENSNAPEPVNYFGENKNHKADTERKNLDLEVMKDDITTLRVDIIADMKDTDDVLRGIKAAIMKSDAVTDRYLARKAEIFALLMECKGSLRKELLKTFKENKELVDEPEKGKKDDKDPKILTVSGLKLLLKQADNEKDERESRYKTAGGIDRKEGRIQ